MARGVLRRGRRTGDRMSKARLEAGLWMVEATLGSSLDRPGGPSCDRAWLNRRWVSHCRPRCCGCWRSCHPEQRGANPRYVSALLSAPQHDGLYCYRPERTLCRSTSGAAGPSQVSQGVAPLRRMRLVRFREERPEGDSFSTTTRSRHAFHRLFLISERQACFSDIKRYSQRILPVNIWAVNICYNSGDGSP